MKYGFSTLVCPGWQWDEIITAASDLGFDGVELRGIGKDIILPESKLFSETGIPAIQSSLARTGLQIPCLSTGACLSDPAVQEAALAEASAYIGLAAKLGAPYIRVLADREPAPPADSAVWDDTLLRKSLQKLLPLAQAKGITILLETNGVYADSARLRNLCEALSHPSLGVLWDAHHPYRFFGEKPADTYNNLKPYIRHVHIKDSVMDNGVFAYRMLGSGDVPLKEVMQILKHNGYSGYVVLEWVKRWNMGLEEPGIVLPHFIDAVKKL